MTVDPTAIKIRTDPFQQRMSGTTQHGRAGWPDIAFDVPFISKVAINLYQGGCHNGLVLPAEIRHVISVYPWERYTILHEMDSELYVKMYDAENIDMDQVDGLAHWVNLCRKKGATLLHCQVGLNRSSLISARALHLDSGMPGDEIVDHLRAQRSPAVLCNPAFEREVRTWK